MRFELQAEARQSFGRTGSRHLRRQGRVPAVVYGAETPPSAITLSHNDLIHKMNQEAFYTSVLTITVDGKPSSVVVKEVQRHPARPQILHLDFLRIVENEALTLSIPLHFLGADIAKGVKEQGGAVEHLTTDVEVSCLPRFLPAFIEVDIAQLELNQILHLSDLKLPEGVTLVALEHHQDHPVVTISPPRVAEESDEPAEPAASDTSASEGEA